MVEIEEVDQQAAPEMVPPVEESLTDLSITQLKKPADNDWPQPAQGRGHGST